MGTFQAGVLSACLQLVIQCVLFLAGRLGMLVLWLFWPLWLLALALGWLFASADSAQAGWFSWLWGDSERASQQAIQRLETANRALQSAAETVNESSRFQAEQNVEVLSAIQALSNERTELAGYLERISALAIQDSQWAAAMNLAAPVLLAVSVLLVAALALWLTHRSQSDDAAAVLDVLLVEELTHPAGEESRGPLGIGPAAGPRGSTPRRLAARVTDI
jgi:hypothetical protein